MTFCQWIYYWTGLDCLTFLVWVLLASGVVSVAVLFCELVTDDGERP